MQAERDQLLKNYEDLNTRRSTTSFSEENRRDTDIKTTNTLLGKWKFLNLEIEESGVSEEIAETKARGALYALYLKGPPCACPKEKYPSLDYFWYLRSNEKGQLLKNYEDLRGSQRAENQNRRNRYTPREVEVPTSRLRKVASAKAETKAALYALDLKGFTLEFFEEKGMYNYRGKNGNTDVFNLLSSLSDTATNPSPLFGLSDALVRRCPNFSSQQVPTESRLVCQVRPGLTQRGRLVFQLRRTGYISQCTARCN